MFKKTIFFTIIIYLFNSNILIALEPDIFVQSTVNRASSVLSENITKDEKINKSKVKQKQGKRKREANRNSRSKNKISTDPPRPPACDMPLVACKLPSINCRL